MEKQKWYCEKCGAEGSVDYETGAGVYEVFHKLEGAHKQISPNCSQPTEKLRLKNESKTEDN